MKVTLSSHYKSIPAFNTVDLPEFAVIVGLNGTGKSQLLEAIKSGEAECDALTSPASSAGVVLLTNTSLQLHSEMFVDENVANRNRSHEISISQEIFDAHCEAALKQIDQHVKNIFKNTIYDNLSAIEILTKPREEIITAIEESSLDQIIKDQQKSVLDKYNTSLTNSNLTPDGYSASQAIQRVVRYQNIEPRFVTFDEVRAVGSWGEHAMFDSKLPRLFHGYRAERIANNKKAARGEHLADIDWLDSQAFQKKFGPPPWEQISSIMQTFGLNYRFAPPAEREIDPVVLFFERLDNVGKYVKFSSLSAGEKVLVLLSIALLNVDPLRAAVRQPQLLLLDEIDASLHPAVLHQWMVTIHDKVVGQMGIPCVMTTHSPVTVALAPEASLFEMRRENIPLLAIPKCKALNNLTVGLPSMEVEFTQRRQVFVESDVDAEAYDRLHTLMKAELQLLRSLNFLSTGIKNKQGVEQGTGCAAVEKVVGELAGFGSLSTFGLLDWDRTRSPSGRIHVLAKGTHYAFDNVILHPLLVGLLLIRNGKPPAENLPRFVGIDRLENEDLQRIADAVQSKLSYPNDATKERVPALFIRDLTIMTDAAFCLSNGHDIEQALHTAFPSLREFTRQRGNLALTVIDRVLGDYPNLCPKPLVDVFRALSEASP